MSYSLSKLTKLMKHLDIFRYYPQITINNEEGLKTKLGALLSILSAILVFLALGAFGKDIIYKSNPTSTASEVYEKNTYLNNTDIFLALGYTFLGGASLVDREKYITTKFGSVTLNGSDVNSTTEYVFHEPTNCSLSSDNFKNNIDSLKDFLISTENDYLCAPDILKTDLFGYYGLGNFKAWDIRVMKCQNTTENNNHCKSEEEIKEYLNMFYVSLLVSNNLIDSRNHYNPITSTYKSYLLRVSAHTSRQETFSYSLVEFKSDEAFLMEDYSTINSFTFYNKESDLFISDDVAYYLRFIVTLSVTKTNIVRQYTKIQKVAADVGGISKFIMVIFTYTNYFFSHISFLRFFKRYLFEIELKRGNRHLNIADSMNKLNAMIMKTKEVRRPNLSINNKKSNDSLRNSYIINNNRSNLFNSSNINTNSLYIHYKNSSYAKLSNNNSTIPIYSINNKRFSDNRVNSKLTTNLNYLDVNSNNKIKEKLRNNYNSFNYSRNICSINDISYFNNMNQNNSSKILIKSNDYSNNYEKNDKNDALNINYNNDVSNSNIADINNISRFKNNNSNNVNDNAFNPINLINPLQDKDKNEKKGYFHSSSSISSENNLTNKLREKEENLKYINSKSIMMDSSINNNNINNNSNNNIVSDNYGNIEKNSNAYKIDSKMCLNNNSNLHLNNSNINCLENLNKNINNNQDKSKIKLINNTDNEEYRAKLGRNHSYLLFSQVEDNITETTLIIRETLAKKSGLLSDFFSYYLCRKSLSGVLLHSLHDYLNKYNSVEKILETVDESEMLKHKSIRNISEFDYWINENMLYRIASRSNLYEKEPMFLRYIQNTLE